MNWNVWMLYQDVFRGFLEAVHAPGSGPHRSRWLDERTGAALEKAVEGRSCPAPMAQRIQRWRRTISFRFFLFPFFFYSISSSITDVNALWFCAETTAMNPQFFVQIPRTASAKCHVVVSVTQHYETRDDQPKKKRAMHAIGFAVYEVPTSVTRLTSHFVTEHVIKRSRNFKF